VQKETKILFSAAFCCRAAAAVNRNKTALIVSRRQKS